MNNQLPAGLLNHHFEFFSGPDQMGDALSSGRVNRIDSLDRNLLQTIYEQIPAVKLESLYKMGAINQNDAVRLFLVCNYGGFDNSADMIDGLLQATEYWPCPNRGICAFEGIVCDGLTTATGESLSPREIEIIRLTARGHMDKEIAGQLNISIHTVTTHNRNIRRKTALYRKPDITAFAFKNQIA